MSSWSRSRCVEYGRGVLTRWINDIRKKRCAVCGACKIDYSYRVAICFRSSLWARLSTCLPEVPYTPWVTMSVHAAMTSDDVVSFSRRSLLSSRCAKLTNCSSLAQTGLGDMIRASAGSNSNAMNSIANVNSAGEKSSLLQKLLSE